VAFLITASSGAASSASSSSGSSSIASLINDEAIVAVIGQPIYSDAAGAFKLAIGDGSARAVAFGVVVDPTIRPATAGNVMTAGIITATTAQWDAVAGTTGGLAFGVVYYLSTTVAGALTTSPVSGVRVLEGLSPTQASVIIGQAASVAAAAGSTVSLVNGGVNAVAGNAVYCSAAGSFSLASATAAATALVVGVLTVNTIAGAVGTVQVAAALTLTTAQWDAVAGTVGGLAFGQSYYLSAGIAGLLVAASPATAGQFSTLVGVALSATQMRLSVQPPIGL
jgi:hypothetical protein